MRRENEASARMRAALDDKVSRQIADACEMLDGGVGRSSIVPTAGSYRANITIIVKFFNFEGLKKKWSKKSETIQTNSLYVIT